MVYFKSLYPDVPELPPQNIYTFYFDRPERATVADYTYYIDAQTGRTRSYHEFRARVADAITALGAPVTSGGLGLKRESGEIVGVLSKNCMDYPTLCHACFALTVPICPLSSYSTPFELVSLLRQSTATRLFVSPEALSLAQQAAQEVGLPEDRIYILEGSVPGRQSLDAMINAVREHNIPKVLARKVEKDTLAYLMFSSGTSGPPKGIMVSHENIIFQTCQGALADQVAGQVPADLDRAVQLGFLPMHHAYGLGVFVLRPTLSILRTVIMPKWDVDLALDAIVKYRVTRIPMVPSIAVQILEAQKRRRVDLSSLVTMGSGAAYLPPESEKQLSQLSKNVSVTQGYGMSESTMTISMRATPGILGGRVRPASGSVGILWPSTEGRILRDDGSEAELNEAGELWVRGRQVVMGYWKNEKATRDTFTKDGWLKTGDRMRVDEWGNLFFEDRAKDTLKVSGMQVSPTEIEDTLLAHPEKLAVAVAVVGVSGGRTADEKVPRAWIVLSDAGRVQGEVVATRALEKWVQKNLSKYKHLRGGIETTHEIPTNPSGKVLKRVLAEQYERRMNPRARL